MEKLHTKARRLFLVMGAIAGWFAVILQFYLIILNRTATVAETIIRFFSFFTILTNILVASCFTVLWLNPNSGWGRFFSRPPTLTAITVYIMIVGLTYNLLLRLLWEPQGLQLVVDELLHSAIPLFFLLFWLVFVPKCGLKWKNVLSWLLYPIIYIIFIVIRGALSGFYPYPFIDVNKIAYHEALINAGGMLTGFLLLSLLLVAIGKLKSSMRL